VCVWATPAFGTCPKPLSWEIQIQSLSWGQYRQKQIQNILVTQVKPTIETVGGGAAGWTWTCPRGVHGHHICRAGCESRLDNVTIVRIRRATTARAHNGIYGMLFLTARRVGRCRRGAAACPHGRHESPQAAAAGCCSAPALDVCLSDLIQ
jgi:hypothetical protein